MSAAHRSLTRLPLEIFENLVSNNNASLMMISEEEEDDEEQLLHVDNVDAAMLREAICQKLKAIPPSKQMPHRRKSLRLAAAAAAAASAATASALASGNGNNTSSTINSNAVTLLDSIQTVGPLLFFSKPALLRALDPLLTYEECSELIRRICIYCSPTPKSAMALLHMTRDDFDNAPISRQQQQQHDGNVENTTSASSVPMVLRYIPTGLVSLDHQLRGGVRVGTLTEIVGMTATAKSQMAMQLCIMAGIVGQGHGQQQHLQRQGAVYIDSEKKMSLQRLEEMAMHASRNHVQQQRQQQQQLLLGSQTTSPQPQPPLILQRQYHHNNNGRNNIHEEEEESFRHCRDFLANVSVHTPSTMDELVATLALVEDYIYLCNEQAAAAQEEALLQQQQQQHASSTRRVGNVSAAATATTTTAAAFPVRLLILDSIAAPTRREFGSGSAPQRAAAVMQCAQTLKRLADELQLAVVVLNQVDHQHSTSSSSLQQHNPPPRAALGTAWHHCVSTRIHLSSLPPRQPTADGGDKASSSSSTHQEQQITRIPRMASVVKSNVTGQGPAVSFEVTTRGLVESTLLPSSQHK